MGFSGGRFRLLAAAAGLLLASSAFAQNAGSLRGTVTDSTGAVVPGATVVLTSEDTKFTRQVVTDAKGTYFMGAVQPGIYTVKCELSGFKTKEAKGIRIAPSDTRGFDISMELGQQSETVTVTSQRELIQTQTGAREGLVTAKQIENLSIISRSPMELLRILPGAVVPDLNDMQTTTSGGGANNTGAYNVNGVRSGANVVTLDGSRLMDVGSNSGTIISPNNDMISEVKVQSSNYAAEFGSSGIQVSAITKGGGSEFHGVAYDYLRAPKFAANDRSRTITNQPRPESKFQYPGFNLSGPILIPGSSFNKNRDKAFFFFGAEWQYQKNDSGASLSVVPTLAQRSGDFSSLGGGQNLNEPTTPVTIPGGFPNAGQPAPGGNLAPYITPMGQVLINQYPLPNYNDPNNRYNYVYSALEPSNRKQFNLRVDYNLSDSTKAYVRAAMDNENTDFARGLWWASSNYALPSPGTQSSKGRSIALNVTSVLSPTTTNEFLFTYSKLKLDNGYKDPSKVSLDSLGLGGFSGFFGNQSKFVPSIINWNLGNLWSAQDQENIFAYNGSLQFQDNVTKVLNAHAIKVGFTVERQDKEQNFNNDGQVRLTVADWTGNGTGNSYGNLLTGVIDDAISGTDTPPGHWQNWNVDGFVQDSFKVSKNLTLEYGVRLAKWQFNAEQQNFGMVWDPSFYDPSKGSFQDANRQYVNGFRYAALGQVGKDLVGGKPFMVEPRGNFAWDISGNGETVIRGGAGIFYNRNQGNMEYDIIKQPPQARNVDIGSGSVPGGLNYNNIPTLDPFSHLGPGNLISVDSTSKDFPTTYNFSAGIARRIFWGQVLEVSYVGTRGRHLNEGINANVIPEGTLSSGIIGNSDLSSPVNRVALDSNIVTSFRPYQALNTVTLNQQKGYSNYNSMQATLSRQTGKNFQYFLAYTLSKVTGTLTSGDDGDQNTIDPFDINRSTGVLSYNRTHILNFSWNWNLPSPAKGGVAGAIVNGWQLSGISTVQSGVPIYIGLNGDMAAGSIGQAWFGTPDHPQYAYGSAPGPVTPTFTCDPRISGSKLGDKILDINCIGIPAFGDNGPSTPPYTLAGPMRQSHDITLFKNFPIGEGGKKLQLRVGAFDVFNQAFPSQGQNGDIDLNLNTVCNVRLNHVPNGAGGFIDNVCDPTQGFHFSDQTIQNFGKINLLRGHRVIEFAAKFYF
jgi:Carboxypeptidase regulatory-like domain/TonB-dependent Receptor Plug Domain